VTTPASVAFKADLSDNVPAPTAFLADQRSSHVL